MKGRLLFGLPYEGKRFCDVEVKLLTLGGECAALETVAGFDFAENKPLDQGQIMLVDLAYFCEQVDFEGVPKSAVTPEYLLDNLTTDDYALIEKMIAELRKKHIAAGDNPPQVDAE